MLVLLLAKVQTTGVNQLGQLFMTERPLESSASYLRTTGECGRIAHVELIEHGMHEIDTTFSKQPFFS